MNLYCIDKHTHVSRQDHTAEVLFGSSTGEILNLVAPTLLEERMGTEEVEAASVDSFLKRVGSKGRVR